jgi:hypothetical protein
MAAIVRTAACAVAGRKNLRSSGFRGRDTLGIGSAMRSGPSTVWIEQAGFDEWAIGLGLETVRGRALDWGLRFHASCATVVSVDIGTSAVLTRDGAQVHKDEYLEARELVVAGLTASVSPPPDVEIAASRCGLSFRPLPFCNEPTPHHDGSYVIRTALDADRAVDCLARLHFPRAAGGQSGARWLIGLGAARERSWIALEVTDACERRELEFSVHLGEDESILGNAVSTLRARAFAACALGLLQQHDRHAALLAGPRSTDGPS